ncbi:T-box transcription factor TBX4-like, partial [Saccostrea cucullata]|uniref:T-box transcription factor TBX4-like n=1 Tax=Saccostrea cuccullata TaxID=36930 RepID=UPI002ED29D4C
MEGDKGNHQDKDKQNKMQTWNNGEEDSVKRDSSNTASSTASSNESSSSEIGVQSYDMNVCQPTSSSSSGYSDRQSSSSEAGKSRDYFDEKENCIPLINGPITLSMTEAKLWYKFLKVGTEMIINRSGRRMFPYIEFSLRGVDPFGLYDVIFDIIPASNKSFKFLSNKWIPIGEKEEEFKNYPFKHPDSPRIGSEWMTRKISFEKIKLSNKPGTKAGIFTLHTFQKYLVRISIVRHEKDDEISVVEFPIRATTFIAVTAYSNRDVTTLKINSNPYSKGFRFPVKRLKNQAFENLDAKEQRLATLEDSVKSTVYNHLWEEIPAFPQFPLDLSTSKDSQKTFHVSDSRDTPINEEIQTDIKMEEMAAFCCFLAHLNAQKQTGMAMPPFYHFYPHFMRGPWEQ